MAGTGKRTQNSEVDAFLASLEHPAKALVIALRAAVLGADASIADGIKWNVPSFRKRDYFATMHLRAKQGVGLILHFGAKKTAIATSGVDIPDPQGLLDWLAKDRAMIVFRDEADLAAKTPALQALLREWLPHLE